MIAIDPCPMCGASKPGESSCRSCGADLFSAEVQEAARAALPPPPPPPTAYATPYPPPPALVAFYCPCGQPLAGPGGTAVGCPRCGQTLGVPFPVAAAPVYPPPYAMPPAYAMAPAGPRPHVLAIIAGIAGALVAIGFTAEGILILADLQKVANALGGREASAGLSTVLMIGLGITAATIYLSSRVWRGKLVSMFLLAALNAMFAFATASLLKPPRGGDPGGQLLSALLRERMSVLEPLGHAAIGVVILSVIAAIATMTQKPGVAPPPMQMPPPPPPDLALGVPSVTTGARQRWMIGAGVGAVILVIAIVLVTRGGKKGAAAKPTVLVDDWGYAYVGGCSTTLTDCQDSAWHAVTYMRTGDTLYDGPCWGVCRVGEHASPLDAANVDMSTVRCLPGSYDGRGMGSCQVSFQRRMSPEEAEAYQYDEGSFDGE